MSAVTRPGLLSTQGAPGPAVVPAPATVAGPVTQVRVVRAEWTLTGREQEVFTHIATGQSNSEIAATLFLSEGTVKIHVGRILAKLGLRDRVQAVVLAYESRLISPGPPPPSSRR